MINKNVIFLIIATIMLVIVPINSSYASNEETMKEQQEEFKIQDFIKNAEQYTGEVFEDIDINELLNNAIKGEVDNSTLFKKILNLFGTEVTTNLKAMVSILAIIIMFILMLLHNSSTQLS